MHEYPNERLPMLSFFQPAPDPGILSLTRNPSQGKNPVKTVFDDLHMADHPNPAGSFREKYTLLLTSLGGRL